jgi:hypothetical protein
MKRVPISRHEFAREMREQDVVFANRIAAFEATEGIIDDDALAVAAQANYICWFEYDFPDNLLSACHAIGTGHPQRMGLCLHISPDRWRELHHYVIAVQRWLGERRSIPKHLEKNKVTRLQSLLGTPTRSRLMLARLYLSVLLEQLQSRVSLGQLSGNGSVDEGTYDSILAWKQPDTGQHHQEHRDASFIMECTDVLHQEIPYNSRQGDELFNWILRESQPPCGQRFLRYQDIRLASIGALKWRGNIPYDTMPRSYWQGLFSDAGDSIDCWITNKLPTGRLAQQIHESLGSQTPYKLDMVNTFLNQPPSSGAFDWLLHKAQQPDITPPVISRRKQQ